MRAMDEPDELEPIARFLVLYDHPRDYPAAWVLREQMATRGGEIWFAPIAFLFRTEGEAWAYMERMPWTPMPLLAGEDPVIAATWML
jgi:hypothetical protein